MSKFMWRSDTYVSAGKATALLSIQCEAFALGGLERSEAPRARVLVYKKVALGSESKFQI